MKSDLHLLCDLTETADSVTPCERMPLTAPAVYIGTLPAFRHHPALDLFNLVAPIGVYPIGATVTRETLQTLGYEAPEYAPCLAAM